MAGGIGDMMGGIGSIAGAVINSKNQARANDIAEMNSIMQWMLGSRNLDEQYRLGNRNLNLQEEFGRKNFGLQEETAHKAYNLADRTGTQQYELAKDFGGRNLSLQEKIAQEQIDEAKASRFDAYGNEVYFDPVSKSYKIRLAADQQRLMDENKLEDMRRSTVDQAQRRRGMDANESMRGQAQSMLSDAVRDYKFGKPPVNEGQLAQQMYLGAREGREEQMKNVRQALATSALRTGNTSNIEQIGRDLRSGQTSAGDLASATVGAKQFAQQANNADKARSAGLINVLTNLAHYGENPPEGDSPAFMTTTQQANAGPATLMQAFGAEGQGVGGALSGYMQNVGNAIGGRGSAMINALTGGAQAMGGALTGSAAAQGNAINNLMQAIANGYSTEMSGLGSAMSKQAQLMHDTKFDLSGLGKIGSGLGGLFNAMGKSRGTADSVGGGTTTIAKGDRGVF
jgi:hypothetical protein